MSYEVLGVVALERAVFMASFRVTLSYIQRIRFNMLPLWETSVSNLGSRTLCPQRPFVLQWLMATILFVEIDGSFLWRAA